MDLPILLVLLRHLLVELLATTMLDILWVRYVLGKQTSFLTSPLELQKLFRDFHVHFYSILDVDSRACGPTQ